ncbi:MAG TPA: hypothetical protein VMV87_17495 [Burkholderiales bacterium]|nr:hypothetical protein [Burkholderiales bacterium]
MSSRILKSFFSFPLLVLFAAALYASGAAATELAQQSSQAGSVSISVKPTDVSAGAAAWLFQVALNTHSGALEDDLAHSAVLVDAAGTQHAALGWDGDPAGGHHRRGVLRFKPISPRPAAIELRILRPGETTPRIFRWKLN